MVKRLPDSELEIMMAIWSCEQPVTRMQIEEKLDREPKISATTVLSFLSRLEEKGVCHGYKRGENECLSCQEFQKKSISARRVSLF